MRDSQRVGSGAKIKLEVGDNLRDKKLIKGENDIFIKKGDYLILNKSYKTTSTGSKETIQLIFVAGDNRVLYTNNFGKFSSFAISPNISEKINLSNLKYMEKDMRKLYIFV